MHYVNARFAVLAAAMTFSIIPLGRAAWASGDKPAAGSMIGRNSILPLSADVIPVTLVRYTKTILAGDIEYNPPPACTEIEPGTWSVTTDPTYGKVTFGTATGHLGNGEYPETTFTFAVISYKWTAHNNKNISGTISDTFNGTWATSDGKFNTPVTFNIHVPVVRPASETTAFVDWDPEKPTIGRWRQTLVPPADDLTFDFSGQSMEEQDAPGTHSDTCWFPESDIGPADTINGGTMATVQANNVWEFDRVGRSPRAVTYYRVPQKGLP
ncbi:MAG: hypothetical protein ACREDH_02975, partial [Methylocella sp.]